MRSLAAPRNMEAELVHTVAQNSEVAAACSILRPSILVGDSRCG
eukprot:COSAG01_NODE_3338_length_6234_cov_2.176691_6_plen_44_part_00